MIIEFYEMQTKFQQGRPKTPKRLEFHSAKLGNQVFERVEAAG